MWSDLTIWPGLTTFVRSHHLTRSLPHSYNHPGNQKTNKCLNPLRFAMIPLCASWGHGEEEEEDDDD